MLADQIWHGLLANLAILVLIVSLATHTYGLRVSWRQPWRALSLGLMFGVGSIGLMLFPVELTPGVFSDLRASLLALAGFFGGGISGVVAGLIAGAFRLAYGGQGAFTGTLTIVIATAVGIAGWLVVRRRKIKRRDVFVLAAWIGPASIVGTLLLPEPLRSEQLSNVAFPVALLVAAATVVAGLALLQERQRLEAFEENRTYRAIIEHLPDSLNVKDAEGRFIAANPATAAQMGAERAADLVGRTDFDFFKPSLAERFRADELQVMEAGEPLAFEQDYRRPDGSKAWLATLKVPVLESDGKLVALITHNRDITERKRLEADLAATQDRLATALENMAAGLAMFDPNGRLIFCNERYRAFFPKTTELRVPGASLRTILRAAVERGEQIDVPHEHIEEWVEDIMRSLRVASEQEVHRFDGSWLHVRSSPMSDGNAMVVVSDITKIKQAETELTALSAKLRVLATVDGLTGLLNRRAFDDSLERELGRARRAGTPLSLLIIDVDRFKAFNDLYGHPAGDECLKRVSQLMQRLAKRPADIVARYGGEEFAVILPETDEDGAFRLAEELRQSVRALGLEHERSEKGVVTISIGVASGSPRDDALDALTLLTRADEALYRAKGAGRDRVAGWSAHRAAAAG